MTGSLRSGIYLTGNSTPADSDIYVACRRPVGRRLTQRRADFGNGKVEWLGRNRAGHDDQERALLRRRPGSFVCTSPVTRRSQLKRSRIPRRSAKNTLIEHTRLKSSIFCRTLDSPVETKYWRFQRLCGDSLHRSAKLSAICRTPSVCSSDSTFDRPFDVA